MSDTQDELDVGTTLNGFADKNNRDKMHTMCPGEVISYNSATRRASIQPTVRDSSKDGVTQYPPLEDVKVQFIGGGGYGVTWEPKKGDTGGIFFAERSIAEWIFQGGIVTPKSKRHHHLSDAFFIPGIWPDNAIPHTHTGDGISISNDAGTKKIVLSASGVAVLGDLDTTGDISASGDISADGEVSAHSGNPALKVTLTGHIHGTPAGNSGPPIVPEIP